MLLPEEKRHVPVCNDCWRAAPLTVFIFRPSSAVKTTPDLHRTFGRGSAAAIHRRALFIHRTRSPFLSSSLFTGLPLSSGVADQLPRFDLRWHYFSQELRDFAKSKTFIIVCARVAGSSSGWRTRRALNDVGFSALDNRFKQRAATTTLNWISTIGAVLSLASAFQ